MLFCQISITWPKRQSHMIFPSFGGCVRWNTLFLIAVIYEVRTINMRTDTTGCEAMSRPLGHMWWPTGFGFLSPAKIMNNRIKLYGSFQAGLRIGAYVANPLLAFRVLPQVIYLFIVFIQRSKCPILQK